MADFENVADMDDFEEEPDDKKKKKRGKKDKADKGEEKDGVLSRILTFLIVIFIIAIWLAIFAFLIKYDVGGFGSNVLRPLLKNVPVVSDILPEVSDEQLAKENSYPYRNLTEAMERINALEAELKETKGANTGNANYLAGLEAEVARLRTFEENQLQFQAEKDRFDREVVFNDKAPDIEEYKKFYEGIEPDNAAEIYRQVVEQQQVNKKIVEQAEMFKNMEPAKAAAILGGMSGDLDLVSKILLNMKTSEAGAILAEMDSNMAAKVTKKISLIQQ